MVKWLPLLLLVGCYDDDYHCTTDAQCNVGEAGRCEIDNYCTKFVDDECATQRRYQHAGGHGDACWDDRLVPANRCAGGQAAVPAQGCLENVCKRLESCCKVAWTDACVQIAQQECRDLSCDTRIALIAAKGGVTEYWQLRWVDGGWEIKHPDEPLGGPFGWVGPAPHDVEPRLVGTTTTDIVVGKLTWPIDTTRDYQTISTISFDRDGRDQILISHSNLSNADHRITILKPTDLDLPIREKTTLPGSQVLTWGDIDRNTFPDAITRNGSNYNYIPNVDGDDRIRELEVAQSTGVGGNPTPGAPAIRQIDWLDFDGDHLLDLAVFGAELRVHTNQGGLRDQAEFQVDCDPPDLQRRCTSNPEPNLEEASYGGVAVPLPGRPELVFTVFPGRKLYELYIEDDIPKIAPLAFPGDTCSCTPVCDAGTCPGPDCTCNYNCNTCRPIIALVARDLDGDHQLDLVAIDARLEIFTAFGDGFGWKPWNGPTAIPTTLLGNFAQVTVSVSGAPLD